MSVGDLSQQLGGGVRHHRSQLDCVAGDLGGIEHDRRHQHPAIPCGGGDLWATGQVDDHIGPVRDHLAGLLDDIAGAVDDRGGAEVPQQLRLGLGA